MPHQLSEFQNSVLNALRALGGNAPIEAITSKLDVPIPRRTLQRWLKVLVSTGYLEKTGKGKAIVYRLAVKEIGMGSQPADISTTPSYVPITVASREILTYIRRPLSGRQPVGYEYDFLTSYRPNQTWYLDVGLRQHLHHIGNTGELQRPAGTYGREILHRLLIDLSWASSRLEGNTYSRLDMVRLIELGEQAERKAATETQMILNHKAAIEFIVEEITTEGIEFDVRHFLSLHDILSENLLTDPEASGRLRYRPVDIGSSVYRPLSVPQRIDEAFREILQKVKEIRDPFEQAFFILVHIPYLQPFEDVNKRTSRLAANIPLLKHNLCPLTFLGVPEKSYVEALLGIYKMTRFELLKDVFVWAYERSTREYLAVRKHLREPDPFRLKYRRAIHDLLAEVVRACSLDPVQQIENVAKELITEQDRSRFKEQVMDDLKRLHEGGIARYRLRLSEFKRWVEYSALETTV